MDGQPRDAALPTSSTSWAAPAAPAGARGHSPSRQATGHLLRPIFARFGSENLIRDLSVHAALHYAAFLPGDYVTDGEPSDEIYFIAEGGHARAHRRRQSDRARDAAAGRLVRGRGGRARSCTPFPPPTPASLYILPGQAALTSTASSMRSNYPFVLKQIQREARQKQLALLNRPPSPAHQLVRGLGCSRTSLGQVLDHKRASLSAFQPAPQARRPACLDLHQFKGLQPPRPDPRSLPRRASPSARPPARLPPHAAAAAAPPSAISSATPSPAPPRSLPRPPVSSADSVKSPSASS